MARAFKSPTEAQTRKLQKLREAVEKARNDVYANAHDPERDTLSTCLSLSPVKTVEAYREAVAAVMLYESELIGQGRGYRTPAGFFQPY